MSVDELVRRCNAQSFHAQVNVIAPHQQAEIQKLLDTSTQARGDALRNNHAVRFARTCRAWRYANIDHYSEHSTILGVSKHELVVALTNPQAGRDSSCAPMCLLLHCTYQRGRSLPGLMLQGHFNIPIALQRSAQRANIYKGIISGHQSNRYAWFCLLDKYMYSQMLFHAAVRARMSSTTSGRQPRQPRRTRRCAVPEAKQDMP